MRRLAVLLTLAVLCAAAAPALADPVPELRLGGTCSADAARVSPWSAVFEAVAPPPPPTVPVAPLRWAFDQGAADQPARVVPVEYSDAYRVRAKIHKIASIATLPLFVANYLVGQRLYDRSDESESLRGAHGALAGATGVVFGVNTVTGAWNLWEGRKDSSHRKRRMAHGLLMMVADAGFLATAALAPEGEGHRVSDTSGRSRHRSVAVASMGIATVGYLIMLLGGD